MGANQTGGRVSERVGFKGAFEYPLAARIDRPAGPPKAWALFAHCFTCTKDLKAVARLSRALVDRGIALMRFDFTGLGESEGDFADTHFSSNLQDLRAAIEYLRAEHEAPQLLIGHSLGGAAVLTIAGEFPEVRAVATLGAPSDTRHLRESLLAAAPELAADADEAILQLAGRPFKIRRAFLDDLDHDHVLAAVRKLDRALLVLHSPVDKTVDIEHAKRIYQAAKHPKSFISLDRADHLLLSDPADARYAAEVLSAWASRYLDVREEDVREGDVREEEAAGGPKPDASLKHGQIRVHLGREGLLTTVASDRHAWLADEPKSVPGGTDVGPTPYDHLLASLGTCTVMTLRLYAERKGWPLEGVDVWLKHSRIHAEDCAECASETGYIDLIEREIELRGDFDDVQRARLLEIADRCPVHKSLTTETVIQTNAVQTGT